ncbi:MAG TPA: hypothetical protein VI197_19665 [Polyangiaceae bacterium]
MNPKTLRMTLVTALALGLAAPATALACGGKDGKDKGAHFQRKDTNQDGFLTEAEVGAERWQRIKVADSNKDNKVSKDEMMAAFKEGKLGKRHGQRKS